VPSFIDLIWLSEYVLSVEYALLLDLTASLVFLVFLAFFTLLLPALAGHIHQVC